MTDGDEYIFEGRLIDIKTVDKGLSKIAKSSSFKEKVGHSISRAFYFVEDYIKSYF